MEYTAFAIAVVESIWPNPDGSDYYGAGGSENKAKAGVGDDSLPIYGKRASSVGGNTRNQDVLDQKADGGWFKIIPLNILSLKTSSSTSEYNNWSITFTADDMIVVGKDAIEGTGLISDILDSLADLSNTRESALLSITDLLSASVLSKDPYLPRRVSLDDSVFNIQDIAEPGDTVTIWYYCDPSEFFPIEEANTMLKSSKNIEADFREVIGSGDRKVQFKIGDDPSSVASTLNTPNFLYPQIMAAAINPDAKMNLTVNSVDALALEAGNAGLNLSEIDGVSSRQIIGNVSADIHTLTERVGNKTKPVANQNIDALAVYLQKFFPDTFTDVIDYKASGENPHVTYQKVSTGQSEILMYITNIYRFQSSLEGAGKDEIAKNLDALNASIKPGPTDKAPLPAVQAAKEKLVKRPGSLNVHAPFDVGAFLRGRDQFIEAIKTRVEKASKDLGIKSNELKLVNPQGKIRRKLLVSKTFGENCYTIMKGHITGINTSFAPGDRRITLNGAGLEHPLTKHMIFFDSMLSMHGVAGFFQEYTQSLVNMNPASQMMWVLTRYAPKQLRWGDMTATSAADKRFARLENIQETSTKYAVQQAPQVLNRGNIVVDLDEKVNATLKNSKKEEFTSKISLPGDVIPYTRIFTPLTYYNMYRLGESIRAYEHADPDGELGNTATPVQIEDRTTVMNMIKQIAGSSTIMEFFVDNIGQLIYRVSAEAWERTPRPEYTPTIEEQNVLSFSLTESDENVVTVQDVVMQTYNGAGTTSPSIGKYGIGRAVARTGGIPINQAPSYTKMLELSDQLPPSMFRYGLRYQVTNDVFGATANVTRDKAYTVHRFYGQPVTRASVSVIADSSYRTGDTVYVYLPAYKKRMKTRKRISWLKSWMEAIKADADHLEMYVGNEGRFDNPDFYENKGFISRGDLGIKPYSKLDVIDKFLRTLTWMNKQVGDALITWDNFPTTLWWYLENPSSKNSSNVVETYSRVLKTAVLGESLNPKLPDGSDIHDHLAKLRFNNFLSMSFYIDAVAHTYDYPTKATTELNLSYGQENICLLHPKSGVPIGFFSVDRKIKDLDTETHEYREIPEESKWRKLMVAQFKEDKTYKDSSFIYNSSAVRNTSNYLHRIAHTYGEVFSEGYV